MSNVKLLRQVLDLTEFGFNITCSVVVSPLKLAYYCGRMLVYL